MLASPSTACPQGVVVIGAGPAGLTAALHLLRAGATEVTVVEADGVVGGISRTVERDGWRFDIGGHRFFTKVPEVEALWHELLGSDDLLLRPRMSRIFYGGKFYDYPLRALNALRNLGPVEALRCVASYGWARLRPPDDTASFETWVASRFGWRLYRRFFKTYTEKVWGVPASQIQADWAAQRIKNLSLGRAIRNTLLPGGGQRGSGAVTSLIEEFLYPRLGPGMMWDACRQRVESAGGQIRLNRRVTRISHRDRQVEAVWSEGPDGRTECHPCEGIISSMPLGELVAAFDPPAPPAVAAAAAGLRHRDFLTVALVVAEDHAFPDNWIYVHDPGVRLGRVQNFGAWSPDMVRPGTTCLGLEYFVNVGDELWAMNDAALIDLATEEIGRLGLLPPGAVQAGYVVRMPAAYPIYDAAYAGHVETLRHWLAETAPTVIPVGRNGMHRYNNQDHSMYTAMLAVENLLAGAHHDLWSVNVEQEYHEETATTEARTEPSPFVGTGRAAPVVG